MEESFIIQTDSFEITQLDFFIRMLVAAGIGFVIGLEREHTSLPRHADLFAGLRTFMIVVLAGFIATMLSFLLSPWVFLGGLIALGVIIAIAYWITANAGDIGSTTEFTLILAYLLGATTFLGFVEVSLALTVVVLVVLSMKVKSQELVGSITDEELGSFIRFVVIALLIFPFLPNETYGPFDVFNPRELGWVIILTSGLGFIGYLLMKFMGSQKGILLTGIVGGLVSSTVVTWVFSKKSKEMPAISSNCAVAILAASTIMVVRVFVWVWIFNKSLMPELIAPLTLILAVGLGSAFFYYKKDQSQSQTDTEFPLGQPLDLRGAVFFGILYSAILFIVSYANDHFGEEGIFISSAIAALTDIDAITISVSKLAGGTLSSLTAQNAILLATLCNTIVKIGISLWAGSRELKRYVLIGYGMMFVAGIIGFFILNG